MHQFLKIWIVGSEGRLGSSLCYLLNPRSNDLLATDINDVDVTNLEDVLLFAERNYPQIIINCTGISNAALCEKNPELAWRVNTIGARNLAIAANQINAAIVQLSTDDVFGEHSEKPYTEFTQPVPQSIYGESKLAAEKYVRSLAPKHYIVRSSWLYGRSRLQSFIDEAQKTGQVRVAENQLGTPTSALELARFVIQLINTRAYGLYHASCEGETSRKNFVQEVLSYVGLANKTTILEVPEAELNSTTRPAYQVLDNFLLHIEDGFQMPHWQDALQDFMKGRFKKGGAS